MDRGKWEKTLTCFQVMTKSNESIFQVVKQQHASFHLTSYFRPEFSASSDSLAAFANSRRLLMLIVANVVDITDVWDKLTLATVTV